MEMGEEGGGEGVVVGSPSSSWRGGGAGQGHSIPFATLRTQALRKTKTDKDTGMQGSGIHKHSRSTWNRESTGARIIYAWA